MGVDARKQNKEGGIAKKGDESPIRPAMYKTNQAEGFLNRKGSQGSVTTTAGRGGILTITVDEKGGG